MNAHRALPECDICDSAYTILCVEVLSFGLTVGMAFLLHGLPFASKGQEHHNPTRSSFLFAAPDTC